MRRVFKAISRVLLYVGLFFAWTAPAQASSRLVISELSDFTFDFAEDTHFVARTYQSGDLPSDPQLWLYDVLTGELLTTNDDSDGLQSLIEIDVPAGTYRLRAGTCCYEPDVWRDGQDWNIEYELTFNESANELTTTTTSTSTSTTTEPETTTSTSTTTTTTTIEPATTTSTTQPATTTTVVQTTTTIGASTSLPAEVSSTTTQAELPTTTLSNGTQPVELSTTTSTTSTTVQSTTSTSSTTSSTSTTTLVSITGTTTEPITVTTTNAPVTETTTLVGLPISGNAEEIITYLQDLTTDDLQNLTEEQTQQLIDNIADADLTDEQAQQIAEALSEAPDEVKQEFEQTINVFSGQFDSYVPSGSTISVGARRAVVAVTAVAFMLPAPVPTTRSRRP